MSGAARSRIQWLNRSLKEQESVGSSGRRTRAFVRLLRATDLRFKEVSAAHAGLAEEQASQGQIQYPRT